MKELVNKIAIFFGGEDFYEKGEEARLEFSPSELREINSLIIENSRLKEKLKNTNWHTGTPTEEIKENDWYTFAYKCHGEIRYITIKEPSFWYFTNCDTLAWQKVEPFEASKE